MTYEIPITCRFCMNSDSEALLDLSVVDAETNILMMLNHFHFKINKDDVLPYLICKNCIEIVKRFYEFKQRCIEIETQLRLSIISSSSHTTCSSGLVANVKYEQPEVAQHTKDDVSSLPSQLPGKKKYHRKTGKHQCEFCGQIYKMQASLQNHMMTHMDLKPVKHVRKCELCQKEFARNENLKIHMRAHLGIKPFVCDVCGKSFTKRQDLIRHMKVHSNDRNHVCTICNSKFKRSNDLVIHIRTHTGDRPYNCRECEKNYTSHSGLRKHLKIHKLNV